MSTCQGAPAPHYPCPYGTRCDWTPPSGKARQRRIPAPSKRYTPPKGADDTCASCGGWGTYYGCDACDSTGGSGGETEQ